MDDREIEALLNDSDLDFSGDSDDEYLPPDLMETDSEEGAVIMEMGGEEGADIMEMDGEDASVELVQNETNSGEESQNTLRSALWRTTGMTPRGPDISEDVLVSEGTSDMNILYCFFEYLGVEFWELVAEQSNLYSAQKRDLKSLNTNAIEMIKFAGVHLMMGNLKYPQGKLYWNRELRVPIIADTMNRDRFFELRNYLHIVDLNKPNAGDKLWKIRPLIDPILKRCHELSRSKHMSIDEHMIPFS
ncbi:piggyBac transposable element-derived protein 3-like isoform X1 [Bactrocera tryoni]|uniref:piggyBac transposable element-derived protein 3-like isoform X1 n=1 Tax=Bactrocera tryoni TaxID=59916 RepID=UPI001A96DF8C|nr:piggyBac transposable element-derived protein 3-like isoform X1 [Bactrocera tryoni]